VPVDSTRITTLLVAEQVVEVGARILLHGRAHIGALMPRRVARSD